MATDPSSRPEACGTEPQLSPVAHHVLREESSGSDTRFLPGCSAGLEETHQKQPVTICNEIMAAYVQMRGPSLDNTEDPLFEWIRLRENITPEERNPKPGSRTDITRMLHNVDYYLRSENPAGHSPRDAVFQIDRPAVQHLVPPEGMNLDWHTLAACCCEFEFGSDEDSEGEFEDDPVPTGRISPCTFLAWSKDCKKWDDTIAKVAIDQTTVSRVRPPTPEFCDTPPPIPRPVRNPAWTIAQHDEFDGGPMSPHYPVPTTPSVLYVPEGIDADRMQSHGFERQYSRMDPMAAKMLRKLNDGHDNEAESVSPTGDEDNCYQVSEVEDMIDAQIATTGKFGKHAFKDIDDIYDHVEDASQQIQQNEQESRFLVNAMRQQTNKIRELEDRRDETMVAVARLKIKRLWEENERRALEEQMKKEKRDARMQDHVRNHIRDLDEQLRRSHDQLEKDRAEKGFNDAMIAALESDILQACMNVDKITLEDIYEELGYENHEDEGPGQSQSQSQDKGKGKETKDPFVGTFGFGVESDGESDEEEDYMSEDQLSGPLYKVDFEYKEKYPKQAVLRPSPQHTVTKIEQVPAHLLIEPQTAIFCHTTSEPQTATRCSHHTSSDGLVDLDEAKPRLDTEKRRSGTDDAIAGGSSSHDNGSSAYRHSRSHTSSEGNSLIIVSPPYCDSMAPQVDPDEDRMAEFEDDGPLNSATLQGGDASVRTMRVMEGTIVQQWDADGNIVGEMHRMAINNLDTIDGPLPDIETMDAHFTRGQQQRSPAGPGNAVLAGYTDSVFGSGSDSSG